ncbi:MAG: hypothetical protein ACRDGL_11845 [Candidatus Limnocylindrales bacterium]
MIIQTDASAQTKTAPRDAAAAPVTDEIGTAPSAGADGDEIGTGPSAGADGDDPGIAAAAVTPSGTSSSERSNRLRADLVRAMRTAAEESRGASLEQVRAEAKGQVERIHGRSGDDVVELRRESDAEIASIREWSKAEIARIRSETDARIERGKLNLEADLEDHAAQVEQQIEQVQARVQRFEAEMTAFFEQLEAIDDPGAFAAAAARMPEPPDLDDPTAPQPPEAIAATAGAGDEPELPARGDAGTDPASEGTSAPDEISNTEGTSGASVTTAVEPSTQAGAEAEDPRLTALRNGHDLSVAEVEAAAESQAESGNGSVARPEAESQAESQAESGNGSAAGPKAGQDGPPEDEAESLGEDALAARLGIRGVEVQATAPANEAPEARAAKATTRVVVVGLVSVSSIASFKRQVSAIEGVRSVGVSSGPDGEFVFKVEHDPVLALQDILPKVPGFAVRVVSSADGTIQVAASDPDLHD